MKNLVMKSTTLFFVCLYVAMTQPIQAQQCKNCPNNKATDKSLVRAAIKRVKSKVGQILGREETEKTGPQNCTPCEMQQCPTGCTKDNKDLTVEVIIQSDDGTTIDASDVVEIVAEIIEADMEDADEDMEDDEFYDEQECDDEYCDDDIVVIEDENDDEFGF